MYGAQPPPIAMLPRLRIALARLTTAVATLVLVLSGARASAQSAGPSIGPLTGPFTWNQSVPPGGLVKFSQAHPAFGWNLIGDGIKIRSVPSYSKDPTIEVILDAPKSGHPTQTEMLLLQFPAQFWSIPPAERRMVIAFHPFGVSHKSAFVGSTLPTECARRGWMLVAPLGLSQVNFANLESQDSLEAVIDLVGAFFPFARDRVYTVGFSMGGAGALSWAMRHQDPYGLRVAGVVCHTGTIDLIDAYVGGSTDLKNLLELTFGGPPSSEGFAYERVAPARISTSLNVVEGEAPVWNLTDVPIYFHHNLADPNTNLVQDNIALYNFLSARGFDLALDQVSAGAIHKWSTMDMTAALDFVSVNSAPGPVPASATAFEVYGDLEQRYRFLEFNQLEDQTVGRVRVQLSSTGANALTLADLKGLREVAVELEWLGLDPTQPLTLAASVVDGAGTEFVLRGYASPPSGVWINLAPAARWSHDPAAGELRVETSGSTPWALIEIAP
jgi:pimeloyl-ACP methyl ester carboxylesterase